uniref:DZANK-type domain-containing protein n=1 Tax=Magallana gigas TaxID=29159 RepID=A0A8W8J1P6_MAGGI
MLCDCGSTLQYCSQCGKKVLAPASQDIQTIPCPNTVEDGRRTPVCGTMIQSSNRFCHECAWRISSKAFLPGAAMCDGNKPNGELCDNIMTPNMRFCSECGKPPKEMKLSNMRSQDIQTIPCPNTVEDGRRTPVCGTMIDSSNRFCHECAWRISSKAFLPGAAMCDGNKRNGEPCDNIMTPNMRFCSECGKPPKGEPSQKRPLHQLYDDI